MSSVSVSNRIFEAREQNVTDQPRNGIRQIFSQDQCEVRGCLDYLSILCIRVAVGSHDLKAVTLKEPVMPSK